MSSEGDADHCYVTQDVLSAQGKRSNTLPIGDPERSALRAPPPRSDTVHITASTLGDEHSRASFTQREDASSGLFEGCLPCGGVATISQVSQSYPAGMGYGSYGHVATFQPGYQGPYADLPDVTLYGMSAEPQQVGWGYPTDDPRAYGYAFDPVAEPQRYLLQEGERTLGPNTWSSPMGLSAVNADATQPSDFADHPYEASDGDGVDEYAKAGRVLTEILSIAAYYCDLASGRRINDLRNSDDQEAVTHLTRLRSLTNDYSTFAAKNAPDNLIPGSHTFPNLDFGKQMFEVNGILGKLYGYERGIHASAERPTTKELLETAKTLDFDKIRKRADVQHRIVWLKDAIEDEFSRRDRLEATLAALTESAK